MRGGVSVNTTGHLRGATSFGASAAVRSGFFVDGYVTRGTDEVKKGWGIALRVTF